MNLNYGIYDLKIYNVLGELIIQDKIPSGSQKYAVSLANLPNGIYQYSLFDNNKYEKVFEGKVIKSN